MEEQVSAGACVHGWSSLGRRIYTAASSVPLHTYHLGLAVGGWELHSLIIQRQVPLQGQGAVQRWGFGLESRCLALLASTCNPSCTLQAAAAAYLVQNFLRQNAELRLLSRSCCGGWRRWRRGSGLVTAAAACRLPCCRCCRPAQTHSLVCTAGCRAARRRCEEALRATGGQEAVPHRVGAPHCCLLGVLIVGKVQ